jgi:hypothetical protein
MYHYRGRLWGYTKCDKPVQVIGTIYTVDTASAGTISIDLVEGHGANHIGIAEAGTICARNPDVLHVLGDQISSSFLLANPWDKTSLAEICEGC